MEKLKIVVPGLLVLLFLLSCCKVYLDVEKLKSKVSKKIRARDFDVSSLNKLVVGNRLILRTIDGKKYLLFYEGVNEGKLIGKSINHVLRQAENIKNIELSVSDIEKLWVQRVSAAATVPIVLVCSLGLAMGILIISLALNPISLN
ncbi:hypothetical protein SAMN03080598_02844 [Algoriphagus boritolerans DSM 17298 = JCM 18970]|uniref:Uncharacterized protein n=2 Tax=Algoriphagus TaxID=246875 RepID=A0A1H5Y7A7_9BACT|nr:hypothetical protein SAMN03080598_02844 [Algoriphagus boritolerans DSM 17298 = JCM 18970]